jgi:outer membrane protein OmpA-like peptidoglycan-associated protein
MAAKKKSASGESLASRITVLIIVPIVLALTIGGAAPWWWEKVFGPNGKPAEGHFPPPPSGYSGPSPSATNGNSSSPPALAPQSTMAPPLTNSSLPVFRCRITGRAISNDANGRPTDFSGVNFDEGSCALQPGDATYLEKVAGTLRSYPDIKVEVSGFTDSIEQQTDAANQKLSECRAQEVADFLIRQGVAYEQVRAVGYGESNPIDSNKSPEGRCHNRRVELRTEG